MRIAFVTGDDAGDDPQGVCGALANRGHDAVLCVRQRSRRRVRADDDRTVPIPAGPRAAVPPQDVLPYVGEWASALERRWVAEVPDVVHAYGWLGGLAAQLAARRHCIPTVQSFHGLAVTSRCAAGAASPPGPRWRVESMLARSAGWVTAESGANVDVLARLRHSRARTSVLTGGVDTGRYRPVGPALARTGLHRIVSLTPDPLPGNGIDIALRALRGVPGAELIIAETDTTNRDHDAARAGLRRLAAALGVADRVGFAGTLGGDQLAALLRSADAVACAPRQPPRPAPVLTAMACGVVVVASAVGVLADAVVDNVTGLLVAPESPRALAAALRMLIAQDFQRESMGSSARSRAMSRFAWERIALDAVNIYHQVLARHPAPANVPSVVWR